MTIGRFTTTRSLLLPLGQFSSVDLHHNHNSNHNKNSNKSFSSKAVQMGRWRRKKHHYGQKGEQKKGSWASSKQQPSRNSSDGDEVMFPDHAEREEDEEEVLYTKGPFRPHDIKKLMTFLRSYRNGAMQLHLQSQEHTPTWMLDELSTGGLSRSDSSSSISTTSSSPKEEGGDKRFKKRHSVGSKSSKLQHKPQMESPSKSAIVQIGNHTFPLLTDNVLAKPYVRLPHTLSPKERRYVHECCVEVNVFHCGMGDRQRHRQVAISIYRDGFQHALSELEEPSNLQDFRAYRPWFCRTDHDDESSSMQGVNDAATVTPNESNQNNDNISAKRRKGGGKNSKVSTLVQQATKRGREEILLLIDQPSYCLRDGIDSLNYELLEGDNLSNIKPPRLKSDTWTMVDTADKMILCVAELMESRPTEIAFDMEMLNKSRYIQATCLIQLATSTGKAYVIDPLAPGVWDEIAGLAAIFADPDIVKVGHAIGGMDVPSLHRDFGIFVVNAFDTMEAAQKLRLPSCRLDMVCEHYGLKDSRTYKHLKANYQMCDWTKRPLTDDMIQYGLYDVHYLLKLRTLMMRDLTRAEFWDHSVPNQKAEQRLVAKALAATLRKIERQEGDVVVGDTESVDNDSSFMSDLDDTDGYFTPQDDGQSGDEAEAGSRKSVVEARELRMNDRLMSVISKSQERCLELWTERTEPHLKNKAFLSMIHKAKVNPKLWTDSHMKLYDALVQWREAVAQREKCLPGFVCPLEFLVMVASKRPISEDALRRVSYFLPPHLEGSNGEGNGYRQQLLGICKASLLEEGSAVVAVKEYIPKYVRPKIPVRDVTPKIEFGGSWRMRLAAVAVVGAAVTIALIVGGRRRK